MHTDQPSPAHPHIGYLAAVLSLQARSRRNALQAARLLRVRRAEQREVDDAVAALSSLLEPIIIVFLGVFIGGLVVAMYLPIFKLGAVVG